MDDWKSLRDANYDAGRAWTSFRRWARINQSVDQKREEANNLVVAIIPLMGSIFRSSFPTIQEADRDDMCSEVSVQLLRRMEKRRQKFVDTKVPGAFTALCVCTLRHMIIDTFRRVKPAEVYGELIYQKPYVTVPKAVEMKMVLDELPERITKYAVKRDRFNFGHKIILACVKCMLAGRRLSGEMVRNWMGVLHADRCVAFVTLMARAFLHKYRSKFWDLLDSELAKRVIALDSNFHVL